MDSSARIVFAWGVSVTFGWLGTMVLPNPVYALTGIQPIHVAVGWWILLIGLAVVNSLMEMHLWLGWNRILLAWIGLVALGMIENIYAVSTYVTVSPLNFSFLTLWFVLAAIGFSYTGYRSDTTISRQIYVFAGVSSLTYAIASLLFPGLLAVGFLAGLMFHGLPILLDWHLVHR